MIHPSLKKYNNEDIQPEQAISFYCNGWAAKEILLSDSFLLENKIKDIEITTNLKSIGKRNKLNKELYSINKDIEELQERLEACEIYFSHVEVGPIN